MVNKKSVYWLLFVAVVIVAVGLFMSLGGLPPEEKTSSTEPVTISTDKTEYSRGEVIQILVKNKMSRPIFYTEWGIFWGLEYLKDGNWTYPVYNGSQRFQVTYAEVGDRCSIAIFERPMPSELKAGANLSSEWNQKNCPSGSDWSPEKITLARYVESGRYRLVFGYGLKISEDDPFVIEETKTIYSDTFTINPA
jgi:hypothetical protein